MSMCYVKTTFLFVRSMCFYGRGDFALSLPQTRDTKITAFITVGRWPAICFFTPGITINLYFKILRWICLARSVAYVGHVALNNASVWSQSNGIISWCWQWTHERYNKYIIPVQVQYTRTYEHFDTDFITLIFGNFLPYRKGKFLTSKTGIPGGRARHLL